MTSLALANSFKVSTNHTDLWQRGCRGSLRSACQTAFRVTNVMLKMVDIILIVELSSRLAPICGRCQVLQLCAALRDPAGPGLRRHAGIFVTTCPQKKKKCHAPMAARYWRISLTDWRASPDPSPLFINAIVSC